MKKQFVTYEIALALKELGWEGKVSAYFLGKKFKMLAGFQKLEGWGIPAPLWQQAIDWLLEENNIWISILHKRHSESKHFAYNIKEANGKETYLWRFNSPSEAKEQAIFKAIEIIKSKSNE